MAEWSKATVLKTVVSQDTQGSNPCFSAIFLKKNKGRWQSGLMRTPAKGVNPLGSEGSNPSLSAISFLINIWACSSGVRAVGS